MDFIKFYFFRINFTNDPGTLSLSIICLISVSTLVTYLIKSSGLTVKNMCIIERLKEYHDFDTFEADFYKPTPPPTWPTRGKISIKNLSIRYRPDLPLALKNINIDIKDKEKIGVVGRTGSGKSTLLLCLMRIIEPQKAEVDINGVIEIDGVDNGDIGLHPLRKALTIIPQDPYLLEGSLRFNIDPNAEFSNKEVERVLNLIEFWSTFGREDALPAQFSSMVDLDSEIQRSIKESVGGIMTPKTPIKSIKNRSRGASGYPDSQLSLLKPQNRLELKIEKGGSNLSLGQKQLICIARALIRRPKILLMDEATASIDPKADKVIQKVLKKKMADCTVITIAHRLKTIVQYDRILGLQNGEVVELGDPYELLTGRKDGYFYNLVKEAGDEAYMKQMVYYAKNKRLEAEID